VTRKSFLRAARRLEKRLKTPVCRTCGRPKMAVTSVVNGCLTFRFECWTPECKEKSKEETCL